MTYCTINFYKFIALDNLAAWRDTLWEAADRHALKGSIYLAEEGINAGLAGDEAHVDAFAHWLQGFPTWHDLAFKKSHGDTLPYRRLLVKIKPQILVFPAEHQPTVGDIQKGRHVSAEKWDALLSGQEGDVVVVDTRNDYEVSYGTFSDAEHLGIKTFREFPSAFLHKYADAKDKTYLMFCTGGIRCEKAVAFAEKSGFKQVYQLDGGIIQYFKERGQGRWQGDCFVFDDRWVIDTGLRESDDKADDQGAP